MQILHASHSEGQASAGSLALLCMSAVCGMQVDAARLLQVLPGNAVLHRPGRSLLQTASSLASSSSTGLHHPSVQRAVSACATNTCRCLHDT